MPKKLEKINFKIDIAYQSDEDARDILFESLKEKGLNPEDFLYSAISGLRKPNISRTGSPFNSEYFYAFTYKEIADLTDSFGDIFYKLRQHLPNFEHPKDFPMIVLYSADKCINIDKKLSLEELEKIPAFNLEDAAHLGDTAFAYVQKEGKLKDTVVGYIKVILD